MLKCIFTTLRAMCNAPGHVENEEHDVFPFAVVDAELHDFVADHESHVDEGQTESEQSLSDRICLEQQSAKSAAGFDYAVCGGWAGDLSDAQGGADAESLGGL